MELALQVMFGLLYALLIGVGTGFGVFAGAWVFFRETPVWVTLRDSLRPDVRHGR